MRLLCLQVSTRGGLLRAAPELVGKSWGIRLKRSQSSIPGMHTSPPRFWDGVLRRLGAEMPPFALEAWIDPLVARSNARDGSESGDRLTLGCPTAFHRDRVRERFLTEIERCAAAEAGVPVAVDLVVASPRRALLTETPPAPDRREAICPAVNAGGPAAAAPEP